MLKKGAKVFGKGVENPNSTERQFATVKAANSMNFTFANSLSILSLLMGSVIAGHDSVHVFRPHQQALFLLTVESQKVPKTKILNREGKLCTTILSFRSGNTAPLKCAPFVA